MPILVLDRLFYKLNSFKYKESYQKKIVSDIKTKLMKKVRLVVYISQFKKKVSVIKIESPRNHFADSPS